MAFLTRMGILLGDATRDQDYNVSVARFSFGKTPPPPPPPPGGLPVICQAIPPPCIPEVTIPSAISSQIEYTWHKNKQ